MARPFDPRLPFVFQLFARRFATVYDAARAKRRVKPLGQRVFAYVAMAVRYPKVRPKQHVYLKYAKLNRVYKRAV